MNDLDDLRARVEAAKERIGKAEDQRRSQSERLIDLIGAIQQGLGQKQSELTAAEAEITALKSETEQLTERLTEAEAGAASLAEDKSGLEAEAARLSESLAEIEATAARLADDKISLEADVARLNEENQAKTEDNEHLRGLLAALLAVVEGGNSDELASALQNLGGEVAEFMGAPAQDEASTAPDPSDDPEHAEDAANLEPAAMAAASEGLDPDDSEDTEGGPELDSAETEAIALEADEPETIESEAPEPEAPKSEAPESEAVGSEEDLPEAADTAAPDDGLEADVHAAEDLLADEPPAPAEDQELDEAALAAAEDADEPGDVDELGLDAADAAVEDPEEAPALVDDADQGDEPETPVEEPQAEGGAPDGDPPVAADAAGLDHADDELPAEDTSSDLAMDASEGEALGAALGDDDQTMDQVDLAAEAPLTDALPPDEVQPEEAEIEQSAPEDQPAAAGDDQDALQGLVADDSAEDLAKDLPGHIPGDLSGELEEDGDPTSVKEIIERVSRLADEMANMVGESRDAADDDAPKSAAS